MFESFRSRLVISNLLITLAGLLIVVFVFIQVLSSRARDDKKSALTEESRLVAAQVELVLRGKAGAPLKDVVYNSSRMLKVRVIVVNPHGGIVVDSQEATPFDRGSWTLDQHALQEARSAQRALGTGSRVLFQTPLRGTVHREIGAVVLVANVSTVRPGFFDLFNVFLVVLGTALLVWLAIGLYFTFSISRPLVRVIGATRRMAAGDYEVRVPGGKQGEMSRLASSFNLMAQQVQGSSRVLTDFVANVSHDLRTPLTIIAGFSQALLDGTAGPDEVEESATVIHEEAGKMQHLVDELLQLTRLESGLQTFRRAPLNLEPLVASMIDRTQRARVGQPHAAVVNEVPAGLPLIDVDHDQFERALRNLLDNALQYTPATGTVTIGAQAVGRRWVEVRVSDTGIGIAPGDVPRIFERFYRTDKSRERVHGHSGLGLAIVKEIVERHGGRIEVESALDRGTTFRFTVPQAQVPRNDTETRSAPRERVTP